MRHLFVTLSLMLTFAGASHAEDLVPASTEKTKMQTLKDWFDAGTDTTWEEMKGVYSGRCYTFSEENKAVNSMFTYVTALNNDGPAFPQPTTPLAVTGMHHRDRGPDYFDTADAKEIRESREIFQAGLQNFPRFTENPTVTQYSDFEPNGRMDLMIQYRLYQSYVVTTMTNLIGQDIQLASMRNPKRAAAGQVVAACYYFIRLE